jgi:type I restriction enzyme M protein
MSKNGVNQISSKVWQIAGVLYDDGVSNQDYLEQLTFLLFLKMIDEYNKPPYNKGIELPENCDWQTLTSKAGSDLEKHYRFVLDTLSNSKGLISEIYQRAQNKINNPSNLRRVIELIGKEEWASMHEDVKGEIYESLLQKVAEDTKSGAGQYFTPRPLINSIVKCIAPKPDLTIADPACGSGGFLLSAKEYILDNFGSQLTPDQNKNLRFKTFFGTELVASTYRQCLMNLFLHNIGDFTDPNQESPIYHGDSLMTEPKNHYDIVLANPPFGTKSSMTVSTDDGVVQREDIDYNRQDFWMSTKNKQLNFIMHIYSMLKVDGNAAVVVPDNVLFEGGAGETVRRKLLDNCNLHTILRLPTGIFYKPGVQANVLFFQKKETRQEHWTKEVWVYDFRSDMHFTLKKNPLKESDLNEFIKLYSESKRQETYNAETNPNGRWRKYSYEEIAKRDKISLDIRWIQSEEQEYTVTELLESIQNESANIALQVGKLSELLGGVLETEGGEK